MLSVVIRLDGSSLNFKLNLCLVLSRLMSHLTFIMLANTGLFAALALTATNAEMSLMFGLLPDCWIPSAISTNSVGK